MKMIIVINLNCFSISEVWFLKSAEVKNYSGDDQRRTWSRMLKTNSMQYQAQQWTNVKYQQIPYLVKYCTGCNTENFKIVTP